MKLWALLEALKPLDLGAEVSVSLKYTSSNDFNVKAVPAGRFIMLDINPDTFNLPYDPKMEDLECELDDKRIDLSDLERKARILLRNLKESKEGLTPAERTVLLNAAISDLEETIEHIT